MQNNDPNNDSASLRAVGVYGRPECIFNYCPNPQGCKERDRCQHPAGGGMPEADEHSGASKQEPPQGLGAVNGSEHPVGAVAVVCSHCGCACRSDEAQHYDHGDGCEGWECEPCQQAIKEWSHMQYLRFLKRVEELKAERAAAGSGKDAPNDQAH